MTDSLRVTTGLIGGPSIARSLSPAMHRAAFAYYGLDEAYALWPLDEGAVAAQVSALRMPSMRGANVTIPHKAAALRLVDELGREPDVKALYALNTIVRRDDGSLLGLNTDVAGFVRALRQAGFEPRGVDAVLLGAGGAARAAAWGLAAAGVRSLTVVNRSRERGHELLEMLRHVPLTLSFPQTTTLPPDAGEVHDALRAATLLINATPIGGDGQSSPLPPAMLHERLFVSDMIYRSTPLLESAARQGATTQDGLEMLVQQGALSFEAWTGRPAPVDEMRKAARAARAGGT